MLFNSVFTIFWDFNIQCRVCYTACSVNRRETVSLFKFPIKSLMIPFELNWPVSLITIYILYVIITQVCARAGVRPCAMAQHQQDCRGSMSGALLHSSSGEGEVGCFHEPLGCHSTWLPGHTEAGGELPCTEGKDQDSAVRGQSADAFCLVSSFFESQL